MKWILAAMALSVSFMVGCQCTEKAEETPVPAEAPAEAPSMEPAPTEEVAPTEGTEMPAEGTEGGTETPPAAE